MIAKLRTLARRKPRTLGKAIAGIAVVVGVAGFGAQQFLSGPKPLPGEITGSVGVVDSRKIGPSGLPMPRFVTLKANKVNVRRGPASEYPVAWVYQRKGYPVEITAEFENWRRIRDVDGQEGWILKQMLSDKRFGLVTPGKARHAILYDDITPGASLVAKVSMGVLGTVETCDGQWCSFSSGDYEGYVLQTQLWGVYPGEVVK
jgi:SH3-like domain-containing protein